MGAVSCGPSKVIYGPPLIVAIIVVVAILATIIISKPAEKSSVRQEIEASAREPEIQIFFENI